MQSRKRFRILVLMLCASLLAGGSLAGVASARSHHMSKAQKARIRAKLRREVKANPKIVLNKAFVKQAGQVSFTLPVTLRFRKSDIGQPSALDLNLGSIGVKKVVLSGYLQANATFIDPSASGTLGELHVDIPPAAPGTVGGTTTGPGGNLIAADSATLRADPLSILTNSEVSTKQIGDPSGTNGCSNYSSATTGTAGSVNPANAAGWYSPNTSDPVDNPANNPAGLDPNTVFRTPYLPIGVAGPTTPLANAVTPTGFVGESGGTAYLFGAPGGGNAVDVTLNALTNINSILRDVNTENPLFIGLGRQCAQTITGYVPNTLTAHVTGSLSIRPDVTIDGRLRLAVASLSGGSVPNPITACVAPYQQYAAPGVAAGSPINVNVPQNPFAGSANWAFNQYAVAAGTPSAAPQVLCGTTGPTSAGGVNPLGGLEALFADAGATTTAQSVNPFAPIALPGVTVPQPCTVGSYSTTSSGCTISLNGTLTPETITADVLIGTPGAGDHNVPTNAGNPTIQGNI